MAAYEEMSAAEEEEVSRRYQRWMEVMPAGLTKDQQRELRIQITQEVQGNRRRVSNGPVSAPVEGKCLSPVEKESQVTEAKDCRGMALLKQWMAFLGLWQDHELSGWLKKLVWKEIALEKQYHARIGPVGALEEDLYVQLELIDGLWEIVYGDPECGMGTVRRKNNLFLKRCHGLGLEPWSPEANLLEPLIQQELQLEAEYVELLDEASMEGFWPSSWEEPCQADREENDWLPEVWGEDIVDSDQDNTNVEIQMDKAQLIFATTGTDEEGTIHYGYISKPVESESQTGIAGQMEGLGEFWKEPEMDCEPIMGFPWITTVQEPAMGTGANTENNLGTVSDQGGQPDPNGWGTIANNKAIEKTENVCKTDGPRGCLDESCEVLPGNTVTKDPKGGEMEYNAPTVVQGDGKMESHAQTIAAGERGYHAQTAVQVKVEPPFQTTIMDAGFSIRLVCSSLEVLVYGTPKENVSPQTLGRGGHWPWFLGGGRAMSPWELSPGLCTTLGPFGLGELIGPRTVLDAAAQLNCFPQWMGRKGACAMAQGRRLAIEPWRLCPKLCAHWNWKKCGL